MIVAGLIYWRPDPAEVERMIRSLEGRVGGLVAIDGVFEGIRGPTESRQDERDTIDRVAGELGLPCFNPPAPAFRWSSEPVKRTVLARLARDEFPDAESLLVIDADEELLSPVPALEVGRVGIALIDDETPAMRRRCEAPSAAACTSPDCACELFSVRRLCRTTRAECTNPECDCEVVTGATMIRHHHLTSDLSWGPSHFEVLANGVRYSTPHCLPTNPYDFSIRHHGQLVKANRDYQRYNDQVRMPIEATAETTDPRQNATPTWGYQSRQDTIYGGISGVEDRLRLPVGGPDQERVTPRRPEAVE